MRGDSGLTAHSPCCPRGFRHLAGMRCPFLHAHRPLHPPQQAWATGKDGQAIEQQMELWLVAGPADMVSKYHKPGAQS